MLDNLQTLKILFLTDIHLNTSALPKLHSWFNLYHNSHPNFDFCFIGGDTANCDYQKLTHDEQQMWDQTNKIHKKISQMLKCQIYFVPGNHDCKRFFQGVQSEGVTNIHNKKVQLIQGLDIVGFGGSVPGYIKGKLHWQGHPYQSEKDLENEWQKGELASLNSQKQFIVLSHIGPFESETTLDRSNYPQTITSGSHYLEKLLTDKNIVGWFHGHTHEGSHFSKISDLQIFNPGAMKNQRFMHFELTKKESKWQVSKAIYESL